MTSSRWALLFGNFVIGTGVLAPAGLINELSAAFAVDVATVGSLIAYGAAVLCIEAPLLAFLTNRVERRALLTGALLLYAIGHLVSAFAPTFGILLATRLVMIGGAAVFTPQAASAVGLFMPVERRAGSVAFIFLGWSFASAVGIPLANLIGAHAGWSTVYLLLGIAGVIAAGTVFKVLPRGLHTPPLSIAAWQKVMQRGDILLLLLVTGIFVAGQFTEYPYIAANLKANVTDKPQIIASLLAINGLAGIAASIYTAAAVDRFGASNTVATGICIVIGGLVVWSGSGASLGLAALGLVIWGSGGGPVISGQQARLIGADVTSSSASVALNTSILYAGQACGTAIGGRMFTRGDGHLAAVVGVGLILVALAASLLATRLGKRRAAVPVK